MAKPVLPVLDGAKTDDLINEYMKGYEITDKVNKPKERETALKRIRRALAKEHIDTNAANFDKLSANRRKEIAADIVTRLVSEGYDNLAPGVKITPQAVDLYISDVFGQGATYSDVLKAIINEGEIDLDNLTENSALYRLIDHVAEAKHGEAKRLQTVRRTLETELEHLDGVKKAFGKLHEKDYNPSAAARDVLNDHRAYVQQQGVKQQYQRDSTYGKLKKAA